MHLLSRHIAIRKQGRNVPGAMIVLMKPKSSEKNRKIELHYGLMLSEMS